MVVKQLKHSMKLNKFNLKNKNILITGAAGLLGYQHSIALLNVGARIIMTDINISQLNKNKSKLLKKNKQYKIDCFRMDVTSEKTINNVISKIRKKNIDIHVLINNACLNPQYDNSSGLKNAALENFSLKRWNKEITVGLTGAFLCSKIIGSYMKKNKNGGVIINISSDLSIISPDQRLYSGKGYNKHFKPASYSVIKTGLIGLTRYLATYWAKEGIRCNTLSPGGVRTSQNKKFISKISKLIPLGRMAEIDEYHSILQFLCSDASIYLNGQNIVMDGGRSVW